MSFRQSQEEFRKFLEEFGEVDKIDWKTYAPSGHFKGFCYVTFTTSAALDKAFKELDGKEYNGRALRCEISQGKKEFRTHDPSNIIFLKELPEDTTSEEIQKVFSKYGAIKEVRILTEWGGEFKRCVYVKFCQKSL